jgi:hypothetical protein
MGHLAIWMTPNRPFPYTLLPWAGSFQTSGPFFGHPTITLRKLRTSDRDHCNHSGGLVPVTTAPGNWVQLWKSPLDGKRRLHELWITQHTHTQTQTHTHTHTHTPQLFSLRNGGWGSPRQKACDWSIQDFWQEFMEGLWLVGLEAMHTQGCDW